MDQNAALYADAAAVRHIRDHFATFSKCTADDRLLGMVCAVDPADQYLPYTLPMIFDQASPRGMDIIVGLNDGYVPTDFLDVAAQWDNVELIQVQVGRRLNDAPAKCVFREGNPYLLTRSKKNRLIVLQQPAGAHVRGKARMLQDILHALVLPSLDAGWVPSAYTLLFDAETVFFTSDRDRNLAPARDMLAAVNGDVVSALLHIHREETASSTFRLNGLATMLQTLDKNADLMIVGANTHFCRYDLTREVDDLTVRMPNILANIPLMYRIYNEGCGQVPGCYCLPGAGTLGRTTHVLSLLDVAVTRYPQIHGEDAVLTTLARALGDAYCLVDGVYATNRCAMGDQDGEGADWKQQFTNWYRAFDAVEQRYSTAHTEHVLGPGERDFVLLCVSLARPQDRQQRLVLLTDLQASRDEYRQIRHLARQSPIMLDNYGAK